MKEHICQEYNNDILSEDENRQENTLHGFRIKFILSVDQTMNKTHATENLGETDREAD